MSENQNNLTAAQVVLITEALDKSGISQGKMTKSLDQKILELLTAYQALEQEISQAHLQLDILKVPRQVGNSNIPLPERIKKTNALVP